jgi:beta-galactosidase/beta-glucuronidase
MTGMPQCKRVLTALTLLFSSVALLCAADIPRAEFPEPQFQRPSWLSLNGKWDFAFDDADAGLKQNWEIRLTRQQRTITVPYCFESKLSGIGDTSFHPIFWYRRSFETPRNWAGKHVLLHFGAVDYRARVWVNGKYLGSHEGGGVPFAFDITNALVNSGNSVTLRIEDPPTDKSIPRGKQYWEPKSKSIFYTRTSGIWQPVWLEATGTDHLQYVHVVAAQDGTAEFHGSLNSIPDRPLTFSVDVLDGSNVVGHAETTTKEDRLDAKLAVPSPKLWSPDSPNLYTVRYRLSRGTETLDEVESYLGFRTIGLEHGRVTINGKPYYLKFLLDQGYWPESVLTPPSETAIQKDIGLIVAMGFNGVRKHQKIADPRFLYEADKRGLLVSGEIADTQEFNEEAMRRTTAEWISELKRDFNHPSIIIWNAINESWGTPDLNDPRQQAYLKGLYWATKAFDRQRFMIDNEGWQHTDNTDLFAIHDYEKSGAKLYERYKDVTPESIAIPRNGREALIARYKYNGSPLYLSEFGGIAYIPPGAQVPAESWGYSGVEKTQEAAFDRLSQLYDGLSILTNMLGMCYTQLTDVEQEVNGLLTFDRKPKFDVNKIKELNEKLK